MSRFQINVSPSDGGIYVCTAKNSQGETSASANIIVPRADAVIQNNSNDVAIQL